MSVRAIIGLAGRAGAGKDTAAHLLRGPIIQDGYAVTITAIAAPVKAALTAMGFGFPFESLTREEKEEKLEWCGKSPRELMQLLGTEWGRAVHPDFWLMLAERRIFEGRFDLGEGVVIVTDCRFPNEVRWVRARGGRVWWIERDGLAPVAAHASEGAIGAADCDRTIRNFGTVQDFALELQRAWAEVEVSLED